MLTVHFSAPVRSISFRLENFTYSYVRTSIRTPCASSVITPAPLNAIELKVYPELPTILVDPLFFSPTHLLALTMIRPSSSGAVRVINLESDFSLSLQVFTFLSVPEEACWPG